MYMPDNNHRGIQLSATPSRTEISYNDPPFVMPHSLASWLAQQEDELQEEEEQRLELEEQQQQVVMAVLTLCHKYELYAAPPPKFLESLSVSCRTVACTDIKLQPVQTSDY